MCSRRPTTIDWQLWGWGDRWPWDERLKQDFNTVFDSVRHHPAEPQDRGGGLSCDHWGRARSKCPADRALRLRPEDRQCRTRWCSRTSSRPRAGSAPRWSMAATSPRQVETRSSARIGRRHPLDRRRGLRVGAGRGRRGSTSSSSSSIRPRWAAGCRCSPTAAGPPLALLRSDAYECGIVVNRYVPGLP